MVSLKTILKVFEVTKQRASTIGLKGRILLAIWAIFFLLVGLRLQGSSTPILSQLWSPEVPFYGYVAQSILPRVERITGQSLDWLNEYALATPREVRSDEYLVQTGFALSQVAHDPPYPVINTNIGDGQNMFVVCCLTAPIWHIASIARPITWGYFLFGAERGLAWQWWFGLFACFTSLLLMLEIVLRGDVKLAAFGAFWFCASAYVTAWSIYPAYFVFFPALGCWAAHQLLSSPSFKAKLIYGTVLGWSVAGFIMLLYPGLQVPSLYACLAIFAGLFFRDRLDRSLRDKWSLLALLLAVAVGGAVIISFLLASISALKTMAHTVYPGQRRSAGGDYPFESLFKGMYNIITLYDPQLPAFLRNQSESSSFYFLFPGVFALVPLSKRFARSLGPIGWALIGYLVFMLIYMLKGLPVFISNLTLMSFTVPYRCDPGIGLASIVLCVLVLSIAESENSLGRVTRWRRLAWGISAGSTFLFFLYYGVRLNIASNHYFAASVLLLVATLTAIAIYLMISGQRRAFCVLVSGVVLATTLLFNPLSHGLAHIYKSEMAQQISLLNQQAREKPYWVSFGGRNTGLLVQIMGGKSLNAIHWHPQLSIWQKIDPTGSHAYSYNRYEYVIFEYALDTNEVTFSNPTGDSLNVRISPRHPAFKDLGIRYVLVTGETQQIAAQDTLKLIYKSLNGIFSIYELN